MNVLVAGGAGYIGSHTVKELLAQGHNVTIFDNFSSGKRELITGGTLVEGDLLDLDRLRSVFRSASIHAVLHFASLIQVGESFRDPQKYYTHNLISSLNLLQAMLEAGVKRFIFSSSAAVYGAPRSTPITEDHPCSPVNPYGWTKYMVETALRDYSRAYNLSFIALRYFNAAGADPQGRLGEMHDPETHLIPNICLSLLGRKSGLELYGSDFPTPDGTAVRDYIHVTDLALAHTLALDTLAENSESHFLNLGANHGYSVLEVIRKFEEITGMKVDFRRKPRRRGDVPELLASKTRAEHVLGWAPRQSSLDNIIRTAWRWHSSRT